MIDLLLLGIIPGTQIQITFGGWLTLLAVVVEVVLMRYLHVRKRPLLTAVVYFSAWRAVRATGRMA
jgi:hypothetical protein